MANNQNRKGMVYENTIRFEPRFESEVIEENKIRIIYGIGQLGNDKRRCLTLTQSRGELKIPFSKLKEFAKEILEIEETYGDCLDAEIFRG